MYEVEEIQDYRLKWLEAERDLAINWAESPSDPLNYEPVENVDKDVERVNKSLLVPTRSLEDYQPGASRVLVFDALKKVAKSPKPSQKHSEQPGSASKGT